MNGTAFEFVGGPHSYTAQSASSLACYKLLKLSTVLLVLDPGDSGARSSIRGKQKRLPSKLWHAESEQAIAFKMCHRT